MSYMITSRVTHTTRSRHRASDGAELNGLQQMFGDYNQTELRTSLDLQIFAKRLQNWIFLCRLLLECVR